MSDPYEWGQKFKLGKDPVTLAIACGRPILLTKDNVLVRNTAYSWDEINELVRTKKLKVIKR